MNKTHRVAWRSLLTGFTGHGEALEEQLAIAWCDWAKKRYSKSFEHWIEPVGAQKAVGA